MAVGWVVDEKRLVSGREVSMVAVEVTSFSDIAKVVVTKVVESEMSSPSVVVSPSV